MLRTLLWPLAVGAVVAMGACADDSPELLAPAAAIDAGQRGAEDAAPLAPATELCQGLTSGGAVVDELHLPGEPPTMLGGVLEQGLYDLDQLLYLAPPARGPIGQYPESDGAAPEVDADAVDGGAEDAGGIEDAGPGPDGGAAGATPSFMDPTGRSARSTILVDAFTVRRVSVWSGETERAEAFLYTTEGSTLSLRSVCPTRNVEQAYQYSRVGKSLALLVDARHLEIYSKR